MIPRNQLFVKGKGRMDTMFVDEILFMKTEHKINLAAKINVILMYISCFISIDFFNSLFYIFINLKNSLKPIGKKDENNEISVSRFLKSKLKSLSYYRSSKVDPRNAIEANGVNKIYNMSKNINFKRIFDWDLDISMIKDLSTLIEILEIIFMMIGISV